MDQLMTEEKSNMYLSLKSGKYKIYHTLQRKEPTLKAHTSEKKIFPLIASERSNQLMIIFMSLSLGSSKL